jgi:hypothetical protein
MGLTADRGATQRDGDERTPDRAAEHGQLRGRGNAGSTHAASFLGNNYTGLELSSPYSEPEQGESGISLHLGSLDAHGRAPEM